MKAVLNYMKELSLAVLLFYTGAIVFTYLMLLIDKIERPAFKNMNTQESIWLGLIALGCIVIDVFIVRRWYRRMP